MMSDYFSFLNIHIYCCHSLFIIFLKQQVLVDGKSAESFQCFLGTEGRVLLGRREAPPVRMWDRERAPSGPAGPLLCSPGMRRVLSCISGSPHAATEPTYDTLGQRRDRAASRRGVQAQVHVRRRPQSLPSIGAISPWDPDCPHL